MRWRMSEFARTPRGACARMKPSIFVKLKSFGRKGEICSLGTEMGPAQPDSFASHAASAPTSYPRSRAASHFAGNSCRNGDGHEPSFAIIRAAREAVDSSALVQKTAHAIRFDFLVRLPASKMAIIFTFRLRYPLRHTHCGRY